MGLAAGSVAWLDCLYAENDTSRCAQQAPVQPSCRLQRQAAHARTSCTMTAAQSGAAGPPERRKRSTVALVALSACVALLAYAVTYRAPVLRAAPEVVPAPAPGECSCNVRERCCVVGVCTRLSAAHALRRRHRAPRRLRRSCPTCVARCVRVHTPRLKRPSVVFRRACRS